MVSKLRFEVLVIHCNLVLLPFRFCVDWGESFPWDGVVINCAATKHQVAAVSNLRALGFTGRQGAVPCVDLLANIRNQHS